MAVKAKKVFKTQRGMYSRSVSSFPLFGIAIELVQVEIVRNICESFHLGLYRSIRSAINRSLLLEKSNKNIELYFEKQVARAHEMKANYRLVELCEPS